MRIWVLYICLFAFGLLGFVMMINSASNPERLIQGKWREISWEYEKVNKSSDDDVSKYKDIKENIKELIGEKLIIHQAEMWEFLPKGKLKLKGKDNEKNAEWRIKGRGHILQLKYQDNQVENYNINELDENKLVINFEADIEVRGIAKLTFNKEK